MFKTIGFPISHKENEKRRAMLPSVLPYIKHTKNLYFEKGYGNVLGYYDEEFEKFGCHMVSREEVLKQDIICDPKVGDGDYLNRLKGQTIFGWIHATQNKKIADALVENRLTGIAWEKMYCGGRHIFWRNNELAGEAAIMHAFQCYGKMPYETAVAVIGKGNTARGAIKVLDMLGAKIMQYDRKTEDLFRSEIGRYDVVVNCVMWDVERDDHIIYKSDLKCMKKDSMIIDVSCDRNGGVETCVPTTIENPTYTVDGVLHYTVDHTPALFHKTFSNDNCHVIYPYLEKLITGENDEVLDNAIIIKKGEIIDKEIIDFQKRKYYCK